MPSNKTTQGSGDPIPEFLETPDPSQEPDYEALIQLARANQDAVNKIDPILTHETIKLTAAKSPIGIIFTSCAHLGSRYVQHPEFAELLGKVLDTPRLYWCSLGDDTEGFTGFFDVASAHEQALADPKLQRKLLAHVLDKLAEHKKLLMGFASQHGSEWMRRKSGQDPIKNLYRERGVPYFEGQAYIKLVVGAQQYKLFGAHQLPGHSMYNRNHAHKRAALFKAPNADVIFQGDKHSYAVQEVSLDSWEYMHETPESPAPRKQWYVQVGTAKTGPDPYTIKSWSPGTWEWPILIFRPDSHQIVSTTDLNLAKVLISGGW